VEKGEIRMDIYGQTIIAGPGDLLLIPANTLHSCCLTDSKFARKSWCHFSLKRGSNDFFENYTIPPVLHVKDKAYVSRLFRQLIASETLPPSQRDLAATTAICALVQYYFDHSEVICREAAADRIAQVITYIDQHYTEPITLAQLAKLSSYSPAHLTKRFRESTGVPPIRYLNNVRLQQAKYLLQFSALPVSQVMEQCGFNDAAYFSRSFKKMLGYSPQAFRELSRNIPTDANKKAL
jgi:AraC-like DNA-binding protein